MAAANSDWMARTQRRNNLALTMLRRPSEADTQSTISSIDQRGDHTTSPSSPKSSHSAGTSSLGSIGSIDQLHALEAQYAANTAQIKANERRMQKLKESDQRMGADIEDRLSAVAKVNQQISQLRDMLSRAERVSRGEFGAEK